MHNTVQSHCHTFLMNADSFLSSRFVDCRDVGSDYLGRIHFAGFLRPDCFPELIEQYLCFPNFLPDYLQILYKERILNHTNQRSLRVRQKDTYSYSILARIQNTEKTEKESQSA
jgi:hypothetical protein